MSDSVFQNSSTMSANDINNLLNNYPRSCLSTNNGFQTPDPTGWSSSASSNHGYTFGGNVSAGQAIYDAARIYHVNPQVLITTLQKEQSVVTGRAGCHYSNPSPGSACTYSGGGCVFIAMSYACPGGCDTSYNGFSLQLIAGTWLLRFAQQRAYGNLTNYTGHDPNDEYICYSGPMTAGNRQRSASSNTCGGSPGNSSVYYDGSYTTQNGVGVRISDGATAALYYYTPFTSGNQSFDSLFENTFNFGSPGTGMLDIQHPDGTLVQQPGNPAVYIMTGGQAQLIPSLGVFDSWNYNFGTVKQATTRDIVQINATVADPSHSTTPSPMQYRFGSIIKGSGPAIYTIVFSGGVPQKSAFNSWNTFASLGYTLNDVVNVQDLDLPSQDAAAITSSTSTHVDGSLIKDPSSPAVYYLIGGQRHPISSAEVFASQRFNWSWVKNATPSDDLLPISWGVSWYGEGTLIKGSSPAVYIVDLDNTGVNQCKKAFSYYTFVGLSYNFSNVLRVSDENLPSQDCSAVGS